MAVDVNVDLGAVRALRLSVSRLARRLRKRSGTGLSPSQLSALTTVERHGSLRMTRLAELEQITKSSVTRLVAKLEAAGLVVRLLDADDGRGFQVELTDRGRMLMGESSHRADLYLAQQIAALSEADRRRLLEAAPIMQRLLEVKA